MELHATAVTFVDGKTQHVIARVTAGLASEAAVKGFVAGGVDSGGSDAGLKQHGVDIGLTQLVKNSAELLLLSFDRLGVGGFGRWPVQTVEGSEPDGSHFILGHLGHRCQRDCA